MYGPFTATSGANESMAISDNLVLIGDKLGLFKALAEDRSATPDELASAPAQSNVIYASGWRAVVGYLPYDPNQTADQVLRGERRWSDRRSDARRGGRRCCAPPIGSVTSSSTRSPVWVHWLRELSREHTYIRYDQRGCRLSDWTVPSVSFEAWSSDLEAVAETSSCAMSTSSLPGFGCCFLAPNVCMWGYILGAESERSNAR